MKIWQKPTVKWTRWYAWYPVKLDTDDSIVWMQWVERRLYFARIDNVRPPYWTIYRRPPGQAE